MLAGCPAETVTELGTLVNAECPQLQLCPLAPALGGAEPALRARGLQGAGEMLQHENRVSSVYPGLKGSFCLMVEPPFYCIPQFLVLYL